MDIVARRDESEERFGICGKVFGFCERLRTVVFQMLPAGGGRGGWRKWLGGGKNEKRSEPRDSLFIRNRHESKRSDLVQLREELLEVNPLH